MLLTVPGPCRQVSLSTRLPACAESDRDHRDDHCDDSTPRHGEPLLGTARNSREANGTPRPYPLTVAKSREVTGTIGGPPNPSAATRNRALRVGRYLRTATLVAFQIAAVPFSTTR